MYKCISKEQRNAYRWMINDTTARGPNYIVRDVTQFVENCAHEFDHDEWLDDPDHWVWDMALDFTEED